MRSEERKDELGEVFTPPDLINDIIKNMRPDSFEIDKTFLDPTCGNGNILYEVAKHKLSLLSHIDEDIIYRLARSIYGVDIMEDNVVDSRTRLYELFEEVSNQLGLNINKAMLANIISNNIRLGDGLKYDYSFS